MNSKKDEYLNLPSTSPAVLDSSYSVVSLPELKKLQAVFAMVESDAAKVAEELFDYLFDINDLSVIDGEIPVPANGSIKSYIKALNRLFKLSRKKARSGFIIINRKMVKDLDKKTYFFCMCIDGGASLDILCEVVNQENNARTPTSSPVKITVRQFIPDMALLK